MKNILVPYDFSEVATFALDFAMDIARNTEGSKITLINVIEQPTPSTFKTMGIVGSNPMENLYIKKLIETVKSKMQGIMDNETFKDVKLNYKIVLGHPFNEITGEIKTAKIDLVVMGTSGSSGAEEFLVGSNAERMVRYSKCPVITLSEPAKVSDIKSIAFATNFQDLSVDFVNYIKALQTSLKAKLHLFTVNTPASFKTTGHDTKLLKSVVEDHMIDNCETHIYNYPNEEDGVLAFAKDMGVDMIAIGTRQKKGVGHFLSGSIAEDVVNHSKVPVWTFALEQA